MPQQPPAAVVESDNEDASLCAGACKCSGARVARLCSYACLGLLIVCHVAWIWAFWCNPNPFVLFLFTCHVMDFAKYENGCGESEQEALDLAWCADGRADIATCPQVCRGFIMTPRSSLTSASVPMASNDVVQTIEFSSITAAMLWASVLADIFLLAYQVWVRSLKPFLQENGWIESEDDDVYTGSGRRYAGSRKKTKKKGRSGAEDGMTAEQKAALKRVRAILGKGKRKKKRAVETSSEAGSMDSLPSPPSSPSHKRVPSTSLSAAPPALPDVPCVICLEDLTDVTDIRAFPCEHAFHKRCAHEWLKQYRRCPLCNREVPRQPKPPGYNRRRRNSRSARGRRGTVSEDDEKQDGVVQLV